MSSHYKALYEERLHFDPFSCRKAIDCRTPLEDIFAAFLGELIEKIGKTATVSSIAGPHNWEVTFIYEPSIRHAREAWQNGKDYSPKMILSQEELDALLGQPLRTSNGGNTQVAQTITTRFSDITLSYDGLTKLARGILFRHSYQPGNPLKNMNCEYNAYTSIQAVNEMIDAIVEVRNPSAHRGIQTTDISMKTICANARAACGKITNALPLVGNVFCQFTSADARDLQSRYCSLLTRVLDDLDKKLNEETISFEKTQVSYRDLSGYNILLDESTLATGYTAILGKLADEMNVFVYEDSFTSLAKTTTNPDSLTKFVAKSAMSTFYMSKENVKVLNNLAENDHKSILEALRTNPDKKFFVLTENRSFAGQILDMGNPLHIAARILNNRGEFIIYRSETQDE